MSFEMEVRGLQRMSRKLKAATRTQVLINALTLGALNMQTWIVRNRLSGPRPQHLGRVTGRLATSISVIRAEKVRDNVVAKIGTNVIYARTHEFGRDAIPARPFLWPALQDRQNSRFIIRSLLNRMERAVRGQT